MSSSDNTINPRDTVITEIARVAEKFSSLTQREMNFQCYLNAAVGYYRTIEAYRQWLLAVPGLQAVLNATT